MATTRLSSKGQVIIPKQVRTAHKWEPGQELEVVETEEGVLLRPRAPFPARDLDEVAGVLAYRGEPKSLEDMERAIARGVREKRK
jgi:AbrB family looped-hinge helix DNA binding protein